MILSGISLEHYRKIVNFIYKLKQAQHVMFGICHHFYCVDFVRRRKLKIVRIIFFLVLPENFVCTHVSLEPISLFLP